MNYLFLYIKFVFFFPIFLVLLIIRIFYKFKISKIQTDVFGLMLTPIELYLIEKKNNSLKYNLIWFRDKEISNNFIFNKWKKKLIILPRHFLEPIYHILSKYRLFDFFINSYVEQVGNKKRIVYNKTVDDQNLFVKYKPSIIFDIKEIQKAESFLKKNNINDKKIITFCARSRYGREKMGKVEDYETTRNSDIDAFTKGLDYLSKKNYYLLRIGKNQKTKMNYTSEKIIDLANSYHRSDLLESYLVSKSKFMICTNFGANELAIIFRIKRLILNFYDFPALQSQNFFYTPMILPKFFYALKDKKELNFQEAFERKLHYIHTIKELNNLGYGLKDNTVNQIFKSIINFNKLINNELNFNKLYLSQLDFWNKVETHFKFKNEFKCMICPDFFNDKKNLFNFN